MLVFHICRDGGKFHSIIYSEVEDRVTNLVGQANFTGIQVVKQNGKGYLLLPLYNLPSL